MRTKIKSNTIKIITCLLLALTFLFAFMPKQLKNVRADDTTQYYKLVNNELVLQTEINTTDEFLYITVVEDTEMNSNAIVYVTPSNVDSDFTTSDSGSITHLSAVTDTVHYSSYSNNNTCLFDIEFPFNKCFCLNNQNSLVCIYAGYSCVYVQVENPNYIEPVDEPVDELTTDLEEANDTIDKLTTDLEEANDTIDELTTDLEEANDTIDELTADLEEANDTIDELTADLEEANDTIDELTAEPETEPEEESETKVSEAFKKFTNKLTETFNKNTSVLVWITLGSCLILFFAIIGALVNFIKRLK